MTLLARRVRHRARRRLEPGWCTIESAQPSPCCSNSTTTRVICLKIRAAPSPTDDSVIAADLDDFCGRGIASTPPPADSTRGED